MLFLLQPPARLTIIFQELPFPGKFNFLGEADMLRLVAHLLKVLNNLNALDQFRHIIRELLDIQHVALWIHNGTNISQNHPLQTL